MVLATVGHSHALPGYESATRTTESLAISEQQSSIFAHLCCATETFECQCEVASVNERTLERRDRNTSLSSCKVVNSLMFSVSPKRDIQLMI